MELKGAIFDMDGTLLDSMFAWRGLGPEVLRRHGIPITEEIAAALRVLSDRETLPYLREHCGLALTDREIVAEMRECMADFYAHRVLAKDGASEFLEALRQRGVSMVIATATDRNLVEIALARTGLAPYFQDILTSGETGSHKADSPAIYEEALRRLGTARVDTVVFEDAYHAARTAHLAGFRVAVVEDPEGDTHREALRSLAEAYITSFRRFLDDEFPC